MDLRQLHTLVAVADSGSFAAAARIVNLTPSAVSQQIQALEAELSVALFDRSKRPPQLNAKGEEVVRAARGVVQIMAETRQAISGGRKAGVLKFGAIRTVSMQIVPLAFARMRALYPDLSFDLSVGVSETLMSDVAAGRLDAAVVAEHVGVPASLRWTPVISEQLLLIAPPEWAGAGERELLSKLPFIRYATEVPLARQIETELSQLGVAPREIAVTNTMPSVVGCVLAGLGVAVVPKVAVLHGAAEKLYCQPFGKGTISRRLGVVQRQVSSRSEVIAALRAALAEEGAALDRAMAEPPAIPGARS